MNLSFSSRTLLNSCPRKFFLKKVANIQNLDDSSNPDFAFGKALEAGLIEYFQSKSVEKAVVATFRGWDIDLDMEWKEKNIWNALLFAKKFQFDDFLNSQDAEIAQLGGRPATQIGYKIDLGDGFSDRGFIDAVLFSPQSNLYTILEVKTTGSRIVNPLGYKNSSQAEGYAAVLDLILKRHGMGEANLNVLYIVAQVPQLELHHFPFPKGRHVKKEFIASILLEKARVQRYQELNFWPRHGQSCVAYNKECAFADICGFATIQVPQEQEKEDDERYDYHFNIEEFLE